MDTGREGESRTGTKGVVRVDTGLGSWGVDPGTGRGLFTFRTRGNWKG